MLRLIKAFFFKIVRDLTFRITLIIGVALALVSTLGLFALGMFLGEGDAEMAKSMLNGQSMLVNSMSPAQNFGIAIPVNLICFIALEFTHGTIRNKIIAGNSKINIYLSLLISGLFFAFALLLVYVGLCTGISSIIGGFDANGQGMVISLSAAAGNYTPAYIIRMVVLGIVSYVSIVSFTVFIITTFRNIGPSIPVVILLIYICYLVATFISVFADAAKEIGDNSFESVVLVARIIDPLYGISSTEMKQINEFEYERVVSDETFFCSLGSNLVYAGLFAGFGAFEFMKRDVK